MYLYYPPRAPRGGHRGGLCYRKGFATGEKYTTELMNRRKVMVMSYFLTEEQQLIRTQCVSSA